MHFRDMRRHDKAFDVDTALSMMRHVPYSIVTFGEGDNGYPYALPVNVAYFDGSLWFHGATEGLKHEALSNDNRVCVTTVFDAAILPDKLSTEYTSLMVYGRAYTVLDEEYEDACRKFGMYFAPDFKADVDRATLQYRASTRLIKIEIEHMTAKRNRE